MYETVSSVVRKSANPSSPQTACRHTVLLTQSDAAKLPAGWQREAFDDIAKVVGETANFPCVFGKNAFRKQLLRFIFVDDSDRDGIEYLACGLTEFVTLCQDWNGKLDTAYPLIVSFSRRAVSANSVEEYHKIGWQILQDLHAIDQEPWPEEIPRDPGSHEWSMCFNGMPLFFNMSCPAHKRRKSRNLGSGFKFVVNPRERFDVVAGDTPSGRKARANIRQRIRDYDGQAPCPQLGHYGSGSLEWRQYSVLDENRERTDSCPYP